MIDSSLSDTVNRAQKLASDPMLNAWVSASAGAGKTTILVRRVLRLLLSDGVYPENILAITYTKAAASEMSNRINSSLTKWAVCDDQELKNILLKVLGEVPSTDDLKKARRLFASVLDARGGLKIQTIHSFCQSLLGRFPFEAGVPKGFKILENTTALLKSAKAELVSNVDVFPSLELRGLISASDKFDKDLESIVSMRQKFIKMFALHGGIETAIEALYRGLNVKKDVNEQDIKQQYIDILNGAEIKTNLEIHKSRILSSTAKGAIKRLDLLAKWENTGDIDIFHSAMFTSSFTLQKTPGIFAEDNEILLAPIMDAYTKYSGALNAYKLATQTEAMYRIADCFIGIYERLKRQQNVLDFNDIIIATDSLLKNEKIAPWVLYKTDYGHAHVLLDESQDTAPEQWDIMKNLLEPFFDGSNDDHHTVFAVGDEKQSIYSFQGADPKGFIQARSEFEDKSKKANIPFENVPVSVSFRSTSAILDMVDATLQDSFASSASHHAMRQGQAGQVHLLPVLINGKHHEPVKANVILADEIAETIYHLIDTQLPSKNQLITAGDIMILVRSRSAFVSHLIRALKNKGVDVAGADRMNLMEEIAVEDLISLLQFMIMPLDDLNFACLLKSPLIGMTDEMIFAFAHARGKKSLWQSLRMHNESTGKHSTVVDYLNTCLKQADYSRPFEILNTVLNTTCPLGSVLGIAPMSGWRAFKSRLGMEADEPIYELLNTAMRFEQDTPATLQNFISHLNTVNGEIKRDTDKGSKDEVRIMTVHGSKGLESPVVIMPDCYTKPRNPKGFMWSDNGDYCLWFATSVYNTAEGELSPSAISMALKKRNHEEFLRLLYVGMTRAEDILMCAGVGTRDETKEQEENTWYDYIKKGMEKLNVEPISYIPHSKNYASVWESPEQNAKKIGSSYYVYKTQQEKDKSEKPLALLEKVKLPIVPDWAIQNAVAESAGVRPLSPSRILETEMPPSPSPLAKDAEGIDVFKRGNVMHRALEILPNVALERREKSLQSYLSSNMLKLDEKIQKEWAREILAVLSSHSYLFDDSSMAEVPISGVLKIEGVDCPISGIIDRMCVGDDTVWIVDFKSNRPAPNTISDVPEAYKIQLDIYKRLVQNIYPEKEIKTMLLWTYSCKIMDI